MQKDRRDVDLVTELASLLRKNGEKILNGESKLSLTTQSLNYLNSAFRRYSDAKDLEASSSKKKGKEDKKFQIWKINAQYLNDFITKTVSVKISHGGQTMQGPIFVSRFKNLQSLELKRVPIHMLQGLQLLRGQMVTLVVSRCLRNVQDLIENCGGDMSAPLSWPRLTGLHLSYNDLTKIDNSMRLLPCLEVLDLSHNQLTKTEHFLEVLTDLCRLNLSFNCIDRIPLFCTSSKSSIKTLALRNNNLDSLEGVEELSLLEELDVADNCLLKHSYLRVLSNLNRLSLLLLQGNPLSFHRSHRSLTLQHISPAAGRNKLILDGKALTQGEIMLTQRLVLTVQPSRNPAHYVYSSSAGRNFLSDHYEFAESDSIAETVPVGSPGRRKLKKKGKGKGHYSADERYMDVSSSTDVDSPVEGEEPSQDQSPQKTKDENPVFRSTKEEVEILREHYGVNWLQVITPSSSLPRDQVDMGRKTEDDIYLNDSTAEVQDVSCDSHSEHAQQQEGVNNDDDIEILSEEEPGTEEPIETSSSSSVVASDSVHGIYSTVTTPTTSFHRMDSQKGAEWGRTEEEQEEYYGAESEPFIVVLHSENDAHILVTVNQRYIIEKDLNGIVTEMLDLKCLQSLRQLKTPKAEEGLADGVDEEQPLLEMKFDYVRKDRRARQYLMEDEASAELFKELIQPLLEAKELDRKLQGLLQCLKCSAQFDKSEAKPASISILTTKRFSAGEDDGDDIQYKCPKCNSQMVVKLHQVEKPSSRQTTPVGSFTPSSSLQTAMMSSRMSSGALASMPDAEEYEEEAVTKVFTPKKNSDDARSFTAGSPVAQSTPMKVEEKKVESNEGNNGIFLAPRMSRSDGFSHNLESKYLPNSHSNNDLKHLNNPDSVTTPTENSAFGREQSWTNVKKRLSSQASTDSDITILTNTSESSIAVLSEASAEKIGERKLESTALNQPMSLTLNLNVGLSDSVPEKGQRIKNNLNGIVEEGDVTPIGSPLTNSVCSSMVSSVYENSLVGAGDENVSTVLAAPSEQVDGMNSGPVADNNNGDMCSIYDMYNSADNRPDAKVTTEDVVDNLISEVKSVMQLQNSSTSSACSKNSINQSESELESGEITHDSTSMETSAEGNVMGVILSSITEGGEEEDFGKIDHKLQLYLLMNVLENEENIQCALKCPIVRYMEMEPYQGYLVFSEQKIIILKFFEENEEEMAYQHCLTCVENQPITELQYVDIGLGYQSFRFEFDTVCSSYTFVVGDEKRCKQFINLVTSIVQTTAFNNQSRLEGISKYNAETLDNLKSCLWSVLEEGEVLEEEEEQEEFSLVRYLLCSLVKEEEKVDVGLVITPAYMHLVTHNHQWPMPRLQPPLSQEVRGKQFVWLEVQKISNIASVETCEDDHSQIRFTFFNEMSQEESSWQLSFISVTSVQSLISAIREPWETEYGVALDVTPVSFTEEK